MCDHKVLGGKLLRVRVLLSPGPKGPELERVTILGDFFMHPEEGVEGLEASVLSAGLDEGSRKTAVEHFLSSGEAELFGASAPDILLAVGIAVKDALTKMPV